MELVVFALAVLSVWSASMLICVALVVGISLAVPIVSLAVLTVFVLVVTIALAVSISRLTVLTPWPAVGKRIILPSSFVGDARYMIKNYHDAMGICRCVGYPNLFVTFTCNPKWPEYVRFIKRRNLRPEDRQDMLSRIFHAKLDNLLREFRQGNIFGETKAIVYTVEFQKRGLPHAHILLFLSNIDSTCNGDVVDSIISAEIPDKDLDPEYYDAVPEYMMHGPCGLSNNNSPCMSNGKCTKHFPKKCTDKTTVDVEGYIVYRRRDDGRRIVKNGVDLDNRFVVPHNRYLLMKYRAHINVEWCNQSRSIKYLFKYVHKGNDRVTASFYRDADGDTSSGFVDEVKMYYDCRYISASEAAWRLFGYDIHFREPNIVRLGFHLERQQCDISMDGDN
ncbi:hypothetical protein OROMI_024995 [Orobanche minor]